MEWAYRAGLRVAKLGMDKAKARKEGLSLCLDLLVGSCILRLDGPSH